MVRSTIFRTEFSLQLHVVVSVVTERQRPGLWNLAPIEVGPTWVRELMGTADTGSDPRWCVDVVRLGSPCMVKELESILYLSQFETA